MRFHNTRPDTFSWLGRGDEVWHRDGPVAGRNYLHYVVAAVRPGPLMDNFRLSRLKRDVFA
jgi:hypothetical protein